MLCKLLKCFQTWVSHYSKEKSHSSSKDKHKSSSHHDSSFKSPEKKEEIRVIKEEMENDMV